MRDEIIAVIAAAVAEEIKTESQNIIIRSIRPLQKTPLEKYIEDNHISYHKYQLGDEINE